MCALKKRRQLVDKLRDYSIRDFYVTSVLCCMLLTSRVCGGTSILAIVTANGIVIGADGRVRSFSSSSCDAVSKSGTTLKIFPLKHKIALASDGVAVISSKNHKHTLYRLPVWVDFIDHNTRGNITVSELARIVEEEGSRKLSDAVKEIQPPTCPGEKKPILYSQHMVEYVIAGYERDIPSIYSVKLNIDWEKHTITPVRVLVEPPNRERIDNRWVPFAHLLGLIRVCQAESNLYKIATSRFPGLRDTFCAQEFRSLTLEKASDVVRAMLEMQSEDTPNNVGFPLTVITIPKRGKIKTKSYCDRFPSSPNRLSKQMSYGCEEKEND